MPVHSRFQELCLGGHLSALFASMDKSDARDFRRKAISWASWLVQAKDKYKTTQWTWLFLGSCQLTAPNLSLISGKRSHQQSAARHAERADPNSGQDQIIKDTPHYIHTSANAFCSFANHGTIQLVRRQSKKFKPVPKSPAILSYFVIIAIHFHIAQTDFGWLSRILGSQGINDTLSVCTKSFGRAFNLFTNPIYFWSKGLRAETIHHYKVGPKWDRHGFKVVWAS